MLFSQNKIASLNHSRSKWLSTFLLALATAAAMFVPYMISNGGYFIFYGDFNVQQIPFYQECHRAVREGNIAWSSITDLGANFIGSYSFYLLGSPFFWLTLPFPNWFVPYLMGPLLILKFGLAALTGYLFIRRFTRTAEAASLGGLLYAFSGFSVYNIFFNHFHEAIIIFPLLLLSIELLITENRRGAFAITVALSAVSNYFFFFGMVVFSIIYFFVRLFSSAIKPRLSRFLCLLFEAVLGLALSCFMLLPALAAISGNSRLGDLQLFEGWNGIMYGKEQIYLNIIECFFFPPDLPARPVFFPSADVKWSSLGGWLPLMGTTGVISWLIQKKKSWQKRLITVCFIMAMIPVLNSAFYAFNYSYYARWFYMPILIMCLVTASLAEDNETSLNSGWNWSLGITLAFAAVIGFFPQKDTAKMNASPDSSKIILKFGLFTDSDDNTYMYRFWTAVIIALLSLLVLKILIIDKKSGHAAFIRRSIIFTCIFSAVYGNIFIATGRSHSYDIQSVVIDSLIEGEVDIENTGDFRIDVFDGADNTAMYLGLPSINAFHSVVPTSIMEFYEFVGETRDVASRPSTDNYALRSLLAVKYLLDPNIGESFVSDEGETAMPNFKYIRTDNSYYIYENEAFVPYGVTYNYYMTKEFCESFPTSQRAALMLKAVILDREQLKLYGGYMKNLEDVVTDYYSDSYYNADEAEPEISLDTDSKTLLEDCKRLSETAADKFTELKGGFDIEVSRDTKSLVYLQIPYDSGWSATVNGQKAKIEQVNVGFMAIEVDEGKSLIELRYKTPMLYEGVIISLVAVIILAVYLLVWLIIKRHLEDKTVYPEGEELIRMWRRQEINEVLDQDSMPETAKEPQKSLLDQIDEGIPQINQGFEGGFKIDTDFLDE